MSDAGSEKGVGDLLIERRDIHGSELAPPHVADFLLRFGGMNPYGEPLYRMALAQSVMTQEAGEEIVEWESHLSLAERGGLIAGTNQFGEPVQIPVENRPWNTTRGMRWVPVYPPEIRGWILQRWFPELSSPADWNAPGNCMRDGTPLLGPYPEFGEYKLVAGPCGEVPGFSELESIIDQVNYKIDLQLERRNDSILTRQARMAERLRQDALNEMQKKINLVRRMRDQFAFMSGSSLEAGRLREEYAAAIRKRGGQIGHVGN